MKYRLCSCVGICGGLIRCRLSRYMWGLMRCGLCRYMWGINEISAVWLCRYRWGISEM